MKPEPVTLSMTFTAKEIRDYYDKYILDDTPTHLVKRERKKFGNTKFVRWSYVQSAVELLQDKVNKLHPFHPHRQGVVTKHKTKCPCHICGKLREVKIEINKAFDATKK